MNKSEPQQIKIQPIKEPNAFYERLLSIRKTDSKAFDLLSPAMKLALGYYEAGRREQERVELMKAGKK